MAELAPQDKTGSYKRPSYSFGGKIGGADGRYPDEAGRYHLYGEVKKSNAMFCFIIYAADFHMKRQGTPNIIPHGNSFLVFSPHSFNEIPHLDACTSLETTSRF
eukprot:3546598-Ditylum_brightwellii.AAC.1